MAFLMNAPTLCGLIWFSCATKPFDGWPNKKESRCRAAMIKWVQFAIQNSRPRMRMLLRKILKKITSACIFKRAKCSYTANKSVFQIKKKYWKKTRRLKIPPSSMLYSLFPRLYHQIQVASLGKSNWHLKWKSYIH